MGTLWGLCKKFLPLWWGKCGDFASVQLRGDWERSIVLSIDSKMAEGKNKVSNAPSLKNFYVFVGISNFKIPLCMYYCL